MLLRVHLSPAPPFFALALRARAAKEADPRVGGAGCGGAEAQGGAGGARRRRGERRRVALRGDPPDAAPLAAPLRGGGPEGAGGQELATGWLPAPDGSCGGGEGG